LDHDPAEIKSLSHILSARYAVHATQSVKDANTLLGTVPIHVIICGQEADDRQGLVFLTESRARFPQIQRILLLDDADPETVLKGLNEARLFRCLTRPVSPDDITDAVEFAALEYDILQTMSVVSSERDRLQAELHSWSERSRRMARGVTGILLHTSRLCIVGAGMVAALLCALTLLAIVALSVIYLCKTFLGIDLLQGLHLEDVLYRLFGRPK